MLLTLKAKYESNFKFLEDKLSPQSNKNEFDNEALVSEVEHFLSTVIEPALEFKIIAYLTTPHKQFQSKFCVEFWYAGSGNILGLSDSDFIYDTPYSQRNPMCIFNFMSSDNAETIYKYIKHFAKNYDIDVCDDDFEGSKCLIASVDYKN